MVDCHGLRIAPGFIELQINGEFGVDFSNLMDDSPTDYDDAIHRVARGLLAHGVTAFCPTIITSAPETYHKLIRVFKR